MLSAFQQAELSPRCSYGSSMEPPSPLALRGRTGTWHHHRARVILWRTCDGERNVLSGERGSGDGDAVATVGFCTSSECVINAGRFFSLCVLGDSLLDPGNISYITTFAKVSFLPNGINFPLGTTRRVCDGCIVAGVISKNSMEFPF
ncbi:hypothetical protein R1flu_017061 [Riccia fluitans]|uniref:Uncharacterized protein n=1 Tax=Riccia fluitans TaxID=41844 RepID=A0ABD1YNP2_9MARC